jgi:hypothetical protein
MGRPDSAAQKNSVRTHDGWGAIGPPGSRRPLRTAKFRVFMGDDRKFLARKTARS